VCRAVQTYVPWNWHETAPGVFDMGADPARNLTQFLHVAAANGMIVLLRAGVSVAGGVWCPRLHTLRPSPLPPHASRTFAASGTSGDCRRTS